LDSKTKKEIKFKFKKNYTDWNEKFHGQHVFTREFGPLQSPCSQSIHEQSTWLQLTTMVLNSGLWQIEAYFFPRLRGYSGGYSGLRQIAVYY